MARSIIRDKSFAFSLAIIKTYKVLIGQHEYVVSRQLLRSATSIGANVEEALAGQSRADFHAKMNIAAKEAQETRYWLRLLADSDLAHIDVSSDLADVNEIARILTSIVKSTEKGAAPPDAVGDRG